MNQHTQGNWIPVKNTQFCVSLVINKITQTEVSWLSPRTLHDRKEYTLLFCSKVFRYKKETLYSSQ